MKLKDPVLLTLRKLRASLGTGPYPHASRARRGPLKGGRAGLGVLEGGRTEGWVGAGASSR
jgi:hypothetical protein